MFDGMNTNNNQYHDCVQIDNKSADETQIPAPFSSTKKRETISINSLAYQTLYINMISSTRRNI